MFTNKKSVIFFFVILLSAASFPQDITVTLHDTLVSGNPGSEMIFDVDVKNISAGDVAVYVVRTRNELPSTWQSALCFDFCFASFVDSIATTPDFGSSPLTAGETRRIQLHIFADMVTPGTAYVDMKIGTLRNPDVIFPVRLRAIVPATSVEKEDAGGKNRTSLSFYPNPYFISSGVNSGSPKIFIETSSASFGTLTLYNIRGEAAAVIYEGYLEGGRHTFSFDAGSLASGIYFCTYRTKTESATGKLLLMK
ncbi:MAG: T9SS type A sorting domain-containing protein [Ignavibacteriaceae bacterium]|nr:T9SS type A sorting domain-containing protein [Ignavibacteriaceae bacterium]